MNLPRSIGLIGDVHCENRSLSLAIDTLRAQNIETIVCTGDVPTGPGDINECCELLRRNKIATVRGNHKRWLLKLTPVAMPFATPPSIVSKKSWRFLESLPAVLDLPTPYGLALLCHGIGQDDMSSIRPDQTDAELNDNPFLPQSSTWIDIVS